MVILPDEINRMLALAGDNVTKQGKKLFEQNKVNIAIVKEGEKEEFDVTTFFDELYKIKVKVSKKDKKISYSCDCEYSKFTPCKHIIATFFDMYINSYRYNEFKNSIDILDFEEESKLQDIKLEKFDKKIYLNTNIVNYYEGLEEFTNEENEQINVIPKIDIGGLKYKDMFISLKVGKDRMYLVKDIFEFADNFLKRRNFKYGKELEFRHDIKNINQNDRRLVEFVISKANEYHDFARLDSYFSLNSEYLKKLKISYSALDEFFEYMLGNEIEISNYYYSKKISLVEGNPKIDLKVYETEDGIVVQYETKDDYYIYQGQNYTYMLYKGVLYRCSNDYAVKVVPILKDILFSFESKITIAKEQATSFCEYILPNIKEDLDINLNSDIIEKYKAESLKTKVYLDINNEGNIVANIKFCYLDKEFNPFNEKVNCNRNKLQERKVKELLVKNNFKLNIKDNNVYIKENKYIYEFLKIGINEFVQKFEVLVTDKFKSKSIINTKNIGMGIRVKNDLLEIELENLDFDKEELKDILSSYRLKKNFYRLKDGSFLDIDSYGIDTLVSIADSLGIEDKDLLNKNLKIPKYRAMYLDKIVKENNDINMNLDNDFRDIIKEMSFSKEIDLSVPVSMDKTLRSYQKRGYSWLKTLSNLGFGGILADDMGLGKTIQIIALLKSAKSEKKNTSIVVCPSSLYINWEKEIEKFSPDIKTCVVFGTASKRKEIIKKINNYDVIVTSYDLLKRDIELYKNYNFNYIIADEAQYIKNNNTKNAKALKMLKGKTRFALTGTPMENSFSELWSIFDFCMPGYLYSYNKFKQKIESKIIKDNDKEAVEKLRKMVNPFILRRTKKEVLKELPDKTESVLYNVMDEKQEKVYNAYLLKAKNEIVTEIEKNGFENSKIKILALITRLRQICCHPSLFLDNYDGESSKLNQCMEILEEAKENHKILVFSQFTSMFELIKRELDNRNIKYYELTGKTKPETRVELVDKFNKKDEVSVFLVSLKAGGTGLNLIGADIVIHFDPWWNLSVQNQATDRAHRIGQKNNVQVFSLITKDSIEEKVAKLQEKKKELTDSVIKPGETFISKMSKEEIMNLFE